MGGQPPPCASLAPGSNLISKQLSTLIKSRKAGRQVGRPKPRTPAWVKDMTAENSNQGKQILVLSRTNIGPVPLKVRKNFHFSTYFTMSCPALQASSTTFWSLQSLFDPDYNNAGTNRSVPGYDMLLGAGAGQYSRYRVEYVDVKVRVMGITANAFPMVVCRLSQVGAAEFPTSNLIHNIAGGPMAMSQVLEYVGDTAWTTFTFRVHPWEILGVSKRCYIEDTHYLNAYNATSGTTPFLAISLGDGMANTGNGEAMAIKGHLQIDYHAELSMPNVLSTV